MPRAHSPEVQEISSTIGGVAKHDRDDPRLPELREKLAVARSEDEIRRAIDVLLADAPPVAESVITLIRAARRAAGGD